MDAQDFNWLDRPDDDLLHNALQQLVWLGALDQQNGQTTLSEFGRLIIDLQVRSLCTLGSNLVIVYHSGRHALCVA